jgi:hypothetical protein
MRIKSADVWSGMPLVVAAFAAFAGIALLSVMLANGSMLVRLGLTGNVWYVLLLFLGASAAITIFALFKSYARYTGKVLNGTLELGGPTVVMLVIVVLGIWLVPPPRPRLDVTVFLHGEAGRQVVPLRNSGRLSIDLGADRREESVGDKGEVRFVGIPTDLKDQKVVVALQSEKYELVDPNLELTLNRDVYYAAIRPKPLRLVGSVSDQTGRPLPQARVSMAAKTVQTDVDGRFEVVLPADLPEGDRTITISADGYETWRAQAVPGGNPLQVQLRALAATN